MTYETWIDQIINKAREEGTFDGVEQHRGQPIDNSDYFNAPPEERMSFHLMKNHGFAPPEVELSKEIKQLKEQIAHCQDPERKKQLEAKLAEKQNTHRIQLEHRGRKNPNSMGFRG